MKEAQINPGLLHSFSLLSKSLESEAMCLHFRSARKTHRIQSPSLHLERFYWNHVFNWKKGLLAKGWKNKSTLNCRLHCRKEEGIIFYNVTWINRHNCNTCFNLFMRGVLEFVQESMHVIYENFICQVNKGTTFF